MALNQQNPITGITGYPVTSATGMTSESRFVFGDRVRHARRPEWGIGSVVRAEPLQVNGTMTQRLSVRFPGVGIKTVSTAHADLQRVERAEVVSTAVEDARPFEEWAQVSEAGWLGPVAERKLEEVMISLPAEARDPFSSQRDRLAFVLRLFRFDRSGRGLIDWSVAQTGLDDPLTRFSRHELEQFFDRWSAERDAYLGRLLAEIGGDRAVIDDAAENAPPAARAALRRAGVRLS